MSETRNTEILERVFDKIKTTTSRSDFSKNFLWSLAKEMNASQGAFFIATERDGIHILRYLSGYAYHLPESETIEFEFGEGLSGQVAKEGKLININTVPDGYIQILSGLGQSSPTSMLIFPIIFENKVLAVVELASFSVFTKTDEELVAAIAERISEQLNTLLNQSEN
jgi:putative methionine-R-sulfoxide reductase with GAF domain